MRCLRILWRPRRDEHNYSQIRPVQNEMAETDNKHQSCSDHVAVIDYSYFNYAMFCSKQNDHLWTNNMLCNR